jgi:ABC-type polysaccharide/polyol phosphate export permease
MPYKRFSQGLRPLIAILYLNLLAYIVRSPMSIIFTFTRMMIFVLLLTIIGGPSYLGQATIGALIALAFGAGFSQFSVDLNALRLTGYKYILVSSPVGSMSYAFGTAIGMSLLSSINILIFFIIWLVFYKPTALAASLLVVILLAIWAIGVMLGFTISTIVRTPHMLFNITDTLYAVLIYAMPVYYSLEVLPEAIRPLTYISPATHASILAREISMKGSIYSTSNTIFLAVYIAIFTIISTKWARWRDI